METEGIIAARWYGHIYGSEDLVEQAGIYVQSGWPFFSDTHYDVQAAPRRIEEEA